MVSLSEVVIKHPSVFYYGGVAQLVEQDLCKVKVAGSTPVTSTIYCSIAQLVEQRTVNPFVPGSSPG